MYNKTFNFTQKNLKNIYNKKYIKNTKIFTMEDY